jgi:uncharacterized SAM-binding protein YcdF (DUF218 family)
MSVETAQPDPDSPGAAKTDALHRLRRVGHHGLRLFTITAIVGAALIAMGFFRFTDSIAELKATDNASDVDAIVVLTGGYQRIDQALALLEDGWRTAADFGRQSIHHQRGFAPGHRNQVGNIRLLRRYRLRGSRHHRKRQ